MYCSVRQRGNGETKPLGLAAQQSVEVRSSIDKYRQRGITMKWTEESIERRVEIMTDRVDASYMACEITTEEYRLRMADISAWAYARYNEITKGE